MGFRCIKCDGETHVDDTRQKSWMAQGTVRLLHCIECGTAFETLELPKGALEEKIRSGVEERARELFAAAKRVTGR